MASRLSIVVALCVFIAWWIHRSYRLRNLPPGPRGVPILGNVFDLPPNGVPEYQHWLHHKDKYGPLSSITVCGQTLVLVHSKALATDLLERAARNISDRPRSEFGSNLCGFGKTMGQRPHDDMYRLQRKLIHRQFGSASLVTRFEEVQRAELIRLLRNVRSNPESAVRFIEEALGAMILKATYGYRARPTPQDPLVTLIKRMMNNFSKAYMPMTWVVDAVPLLRHIPPWFPGASFHRTAKQWKWVLELTAQIPFQFALCRMESGDEEDTYVSRALQQDDKVYNLDPLYSASLQDAVKWSAVTMYGAGTDSTVATLKSFILAMVKFPRVQAKAQEELDNIIGLERLPELGDRPNLPYIDALVQEIYRWHPAGPLGLPHMTAKAMEYNGYYIPKGSHIYAAIRWFCHDPESYSTPHTFDPTRFLDPRNEPDPKKVAFGYGYRSCMGRYFADATVFQAVALLLATFNIEQATDQSGKLIDVPVHSTAGLIDHVEPFAHKFTLRSLRAGQLLGDMQETTVGDDVAQVETAELLSALT